MDARRGGWEALGVGALGLLGAATMGLSAALLWLFVSRPGLLVGPSANEPLDLIWQVVSEALRVLWLALTRLL